MLFQRQPSCGCIFVVMYVASKLDVWSEEIFSSELAYRLHGSLPAGLCWMQKMELWSEDNQPSCYCYSILRGNVVAKVHIMWSENVGWKVWALPARDMVANHPSPSTGTGIILPPRAQRPRGVLHQARLEGHQPQHIITHGHHHPTAAVHQQHRHPSHHHHHHPHCEAADAHTLF